MSAYNWNWAVIVSEPYVGWLLDGLAVTVMLALSSWAIALVLGTVIGLARTLPSAPLRWLATGYVELFRNIPVLVQMFLWFFVLPELLPREAGHWLKRDLPHPEFFSAMVCLGLYTASRVAEQVRSGITSVPPGLAAAARASGLSLAQTYRYVLVPLGFRIIVPPLTSEFLGIFKNTSIALTIGVMEITASSRQIESYTFQGYEAFAAATALYLLLALLLLFLTRRIEARTRIPGWIARSNT
ncbi:MAG: gltJ [Rhodospirillales bacterium]|nr:gltJ [Rhodospirillales bacterium]